MVRRASTSLERAAACPCGECCWEVARERVRRRSKRIGIFLVLMFEEEQEGEVEEEHQMEDGFTTGLLYEVETKPILKNFSK